MSPVISASLEHHHHLPILAASDVPTAPSERITRIINMINEGELTGDLRGDFTELRVFQNGEFIDILSLIASNTTGVNDI